MWFRPNTLQVHRVFDATDGGESVGSSLAHERLIEGLMNDVDVKTLYMFAHLKGEAEKLCLERRGRCVNGSPYDHMERGDERSGKGKDPPPRLTDYHLWREVLHRPQPRPSVSRRSILIPEILFCLGPTSVDMHLVWAYARVG